MISGSLIMDIKYTEYQILICKINSFIVHCAIVHLLEEISANMTNY